MWSMTYLNCLMACTVFAQTLETQCCCVCSSEGADLSATSGHARQNLSFPSTPTSAPPLPSFLPLKRSTSVTLVSFDNQPPSNVLVAPRHLVMMMMMSPLCLSLVLTVFFENLYVVRLGLLYFCVKSWHYKSMLKRDWTKQMALWEEGYASSRAAGPSLVAISATVGPFCHCFCQ